MNDTTTIVHEDDAATEAEGHAPTSQLRVGRISFLNTYPMHWALDTPHALTGVPTDINRALLAGELDVACISSIEYARNHEGLMLLPSLCVATPGASGSIFAITHSALRDLTDLYVTPASATSAALLQMLCRLNGGAPRVHQLSDDVATVVKQDGAAALLIGDDAMRARGRDDLQTAQFLDLAEHWTQRTGAPMVFAVWAARRQICEAQHERVVEFDRELVASLEAFSASTTAVEDAAAAYAMSEQQVRDYVTGLSYRFDASERQGLAEFFALAAEHDLIEHAPELRFVDEHVQPNNVAWRNRLPAPSSQGEAGGEQLDRSLEASLAIERAAAQVDVDGVLEKALRGDRVDEVDAVALLVSKRLVDVGRVAHELRSRRCAPDEITFIVDRNINYTNICITDCGFCAFYRKPGDTAEGYVLPNDVIYEKIRETIGLGGTAALLQGGHHPDLGIEYYVELFQGIKERFPGFHLHALSPPEIQHISRRSRMPVSEVLSTLRDAGLDSLPGGGAEMLVDRVRRIIAPRKTRTRDWLGIMREAQRLGMSTSASMMYGHVETLAERVEHMRRVRDLQDETGGFRAFISWTFQPGDTPLARRIAAGDVPGAGHLPPPPTPFDYLLTQAVSRIYLDNVANVQSSWVTQGLKVGQAALLFGANDLGSIMIEENVVSSAGTTYRATVDDFVHAIRAAGAVPVQRDTLYRTVRRYD